MLCIRKKTFFKVAPNLMWKEQKFRRVTNELCRPYSIQRLDVPQRSLNLYSLGSLDEKSFYVVTMSKDFVATDTELIGISARVTVSFTVGWTISDSFLGTGHYLLGGGGGGEGHYFCAPLWGGPFLKQIH